MSATTHIRFRGDKRDTWTVSSLAQIGPDDQAEIVYRTTQTSPLFTTLDATYGDDLFLVFPYEQGIDNSLIGKKVYSHYYDMYVDIIDVFVPYGSPQKVDIEISNALDYTAAPPGGAQGTLVEIYNDEYVYVSKSGNDANTGTPASPKLTIQAAIDAAVAAGATHVHILDSGVYEERLDLKGITVEAASGKTPTVLFPIEPFAEPATGITAAVRQVAEYTINGDPCLYAAAADGLYRSTDGKSWSKVLLSGHALGGVCVWNDECYVVSNTDNNIYKISDAGSASLFASGATSRLSGTTVYGGLFAIGSLALYVSVGDDPIFSITYNGAWKVYASDDVNYPIQVLYDPEYSLERAFFVGSENLFGSLDVSTFIPTTYSTVPVRFLSFNRKMLYGAFLDNFKKLSSPFTPTVWVDALSYTATPMTTMTGVQNLFFDDYGYLHITHLWTGPYTTHYISKDNGRSFEYVNAVFINMEQSCRTSVQFIGVSIAGKSGGGLLAWDRRHIINTVESGVLSGCIVDGNEMAVDAYAGTVNFEYCRVRNNYRPCEDIAESVEHKRTRFEDMRDSSFRGSSVIDCIIDKCEFARFVGSAVRITGPGVSVEECTIAASGRGLKLDAAPASVTRCIISGNTVDIESAVSGAVIEDTCFETRAGLPLIEAECIIGNPLFVDDSGANLTLKSRALGYPVDSALLDDFNTGSPVDMRESIGARRYSRVLSSSSYGLDYMLHCNPGTVRNAYRPANYDKAYSQNGSMYGRETNASAHKLARTLSWDSTGGEDAKTKAQAAMLRYIYGLDSVFDVGDSTDGKDFVPRRTGLKVSTFIRVSFGASDPLIAPNEHAGAWCIDETGTIIGRIDSHTASYLSSGVYVIDITWQSGTDLPTATSVCKIDVFRRFRIDKTQPFAPTCQMPYVPGIISDIPTQYDITLEEVDE